jgi:hypothetical protein
VTAATIATTPKHTTPITFRSISGFALPSVIHNNQPLLFRFSISETSVTALCRTTGIGYDLGHNGIFIATTKNKKGQFKGQPIG